VGYLQEQIHHTLPQVNIVLEIVWIMLTATELVHHLKVSGACCIFTDKERLPTVLKAKQQLNIQNISIYLIDIETGGTSDEGINTLQELLSHGQLEWERIYDIDVASERLAYTRADFQC
jgi:hypothetical protein